MGRLVRVPQPEVAKLPLGGMEEILHPGIGGMQPHQPAPAADHYLERIAKYVPAEVIAFFIFINAILDQVVRTGGQTATMASLPVMSVAIGALIVATILTPVFIWYVREEGDAWITNAIVSTLAFPFWAYALGAVAFADYRDGNLAVILLSTFTVVSGLVAPRKRRAKAKAAQPAPAPKERPHLVDASADLSRTTGYESLAAR
ncbi:MAG: hypothetical protein WD073_02840 [Xanthobacteraceae bacterium]